MVQVRVAGVALDAAGQHVILLKPIDAEPGEGSILPIWIGALEATSILIAVQGEPPPRPLAHDLLAIVLETLDAQVARVEVTRIDDGTFFAELVLTAGGASRHVDCRPSDAIAIAARTSAPIWVADAVMAEAGMADNLVEQDSEQNLEEFRRFLEEVDPDDFRG